MPKLKMTTRAIDNLPKPTDSRVDYIDTASRGLVLRVSHTGIKAWSVVYRVLGAGGETDLGRKLRGPQQRVSLGTYPMLSLAEARTRAAEINEMADKGLDPKAPQKEAAQKRQDTSVAVIAERMLSMEKHRSVEKYRSVFQLHINPHVIETDSSGKEHTLGDLPMGDLKVSHIDNLVDRMIHNDREGMAREVRKMMRKLCGFAKSREITDNNIMADYQRNDIAYQPRDRVLTNEEMVKVWKAADAMSNPHGPMIQLLMLTGLRRNEVAHLKWEELDEGNRGIHLAQDRSKNGRRIFAPMSDAAWNVLISIPRLEGPYVFSTREGHLATVLGSKVTDSLRENSGVHDFTLHDLRRTLRTKLAMLDVDRNIAERVLSHSQSKDQYDQYSYKEQRRAALNRFAGFLEGLVAEDATKAGATAEDGVLADEPT